MRKILKNILIVLLILFMINIACEREINNDGEVKNTVVSKDEIKLVYYDNYPPYSYKDKDGNMKGILIDLLEEVLVNRMGINVSHEGYPWARAQYLVQYGQADAFCTLANEKRKEYTIVSQNPVIINKVKVYTGKDNPRLGEIRKIKTISDLNKFRIGYFRGSGWVEKNLKDLDIFYVNTIEQLLNLLKVNRVDIFPQINYIVRYIIKKNKYEDSIVELENTLETYPFNLCISKSSKYKELMPEIDEYLKEIHEDGTYQKILDKYLK